MSQVSNFCQRLGIDLVQAAKNELAFLEEVAEYPNLCSGPVVIEAIRRYEMLWLPLASRYSSTYQLAAPLDVAWVWHVHMLAPYYYEQDCLNILSKVLDHSPLDNMQRCRGLQKAKQLWQLAYYPAEPFEIDLTKPLTVTTGYWSKIQYKLEEACSRQFKFYYQVSLPHYRDYLFLEEAVERYEHYLRLKRLHPDVFMVPCYDFDLIWHAHQLHPLNYRQTTTELLGKPLHHDDTATGRTPGSKLYESEKKTRAVWESAGLQFAKPGAMYRGDPPDPKPSRPNWLYAPLARSEYPCEILSMEAIGLKKNKTLILRLENKRGRKLFSQTFKGDKRTRNAQPRKWTFDNATNHPIKVCLYKKDLLGKKLLAMEELDLLPYFEAIPFVDNAGGSFQRVTVDVPLNRGKYTVFSSITIQIDYPAIVKYSFESKPKKVFTHGYHPSLILSSPQLMLSPTDLAKPFVPCDFATVPVFNWREDQRFSCRVVHSAAALLSAAEIIDVFSNQVMATAHTISPSMLPGRESVEEHRNSIVLNQAEGERAMLIRGNKDWAVCIGRWQNVSQAAGRRKSKTMCFVAIKVYKLSGGKRGWCSVRKLKGGLFLIKIDADTMVRVDLKKNKIEISPRTQDIPEVLALAFSVSILHLLCTPYNPKPLQESIPAARTNSAISSSFYSAGYLSTKVPTNVYLAVARKVCIASEALNVAKFSGYDFNQDLSCYWNQGLEEIVGDFERGNEESGRVGCSSFSDIGGGGCVGGGNGGGRVGGGCVGGGDGGGWNAGGGCGGAGGCGGGCSGGCGGD